jgi:hypothetical protein
VPLITYSSRRVASLLQGGTTDRRRQAAGYVRSAEKDAAQSPPRCYSDTAKYSLNKPTLFPRRQADARASRRREAPGAPGSIVIAPERQP